MANSPQARKRARQNVKTRHHNASQRSTMRTSVKSFIKALEGGDKEAAMSAYRQATSSIDRALGKGLHNKNRAARMKSRLNARLKRMEAAS